MYCSLTSEFVFVVCVNWLLILWFILLARNYTIDGSAIADPFEVKVKKVIVC